MGAPSEISESVEEVTTMKRWQDWVNLVLGAWTLASPWVLGFADGQSVAAWSAWVLGAAIIVFAGIAVSIPKTWEEAINMGVSEFLCLRRVDLNSSDW